MAIGQRRCLAALQLNMNEPSVWAYMLWKMGEERQSSLYLDERIFELSVDFWEKGAASRLRLRKFAACLEARRETVQPGGTGVQAASRQLASDRRRKGGRGWEA